MPIKVLVVEDSDYQLKTISNTVSEKEMIEAIEITKDGAEIVELVQELNPDVLLLDVLMN